jgi:hypothetical protein
MTVREGPNVLCFSACNSYTPLARSERVAFNAYRLWSSTCPVATHTYVAGHVIAHALARTHTYSPEIQRAPIGPPLTDGKYFPGASKKVNCPRRAYCLATVPPSAVPRTFKIVTAVARGMHFPKFVRHISTFPLTGRPVSLGAYY